MTRLVQLEKQIAKLERRANFLNEISSKYWTARRITFVLGALFALAFCNFAGRAGGWLVAGVFVIEFSIVTVFHNKVRDSLTRNELLIEIKKVQIARIHLDWEHIPLGDPLAHPIPGHPFETDLDITGERSLHRLLDSAVTKEGSERLKSWLLNPRPDRRLIERRQTLVQELKSHSWFRDKLQLLSAVARRNIGPARSRSGVSSLWNSSKLVEWLERTRRKDSLLPTVVLLFVLSALNIACIALAFFELIPPIWPLTFVIYAGTMLLKQSRIATAWGELQELEKTLTHFRVVFRYLESRCYANTPGVANICAPFVDESRRPSVEMRRLGRLAAALGVRTNPILALLVY